MSGQTPETEQALRTRMTDGGVPGIVQDAYVRAHARWRGGETGRLDWETIAAPSEGDLVDAAAVAGADARAAGLARLDELAVLKLNGGMGTSMGLDRAKSLLEVRDGRSFLALVAGQIAALREAHGARLPLVLMDSFRTRDDSLAALKDFAQPGDLPLDFLQHRVPRVLADSGLPITLDDEAEAWCPPGHGDIYLALLTSGVLDKLRADGYRYAFVSNIDNLGATVDPALYGWFVGSGAPFAMEVTPKTLADRKGGTLVRDVRQGPDGPLILLEKAMVAPDNVAEFEDITRFTVFNTNSFWWDLDAIAETLASGGLELPLIVNPKAVAGHDVVQLETAMGAAIGLFQGARGLTVSRARFAPVKTTADLLAVRSDAYALDEEGGLRPSPARRDGPLGASPPDIVLDGEHHKKVGDFERHFPHPVGLLECKSLRIEGPVTFGRDVTVRGDVVVTASEPTTIADGTVLER